MPKAAANFIQALVAILLGNAAYFLLARYLPPRAHHVPFHVDLGSLIDFWFCLVVFGLIKTITAWKRASHRPKG